MRKKQSKNNQNTQKQSLINLVKANVRSLTLAGFGILMVVIAAYQLYIHNRAIKSNTGKINLSDIVESSDIEPSEVKPQESDIIHVAPEMPKKITIDSVGINGYVQQVGTGVDGTIAVPTNIHIAGWFTKSVKPGAKGLSIVDGHVQGIYEQGIFRNLNQVKSCDEIVIEYGDGIKKKFEVDSTVDIPKAEATGAVYRRIPGIESQLTVITCTGKYDNASRSYENRFIVYAKLTE